MATDLVIKRARIRRRQAGGDCDGSEVGVETGVIQRMGEAERVTSFVTRDSPPLESNLLDTLIRTSPYRSFCHLLFPYCNPFPLTVRGKLAIFTTWCHAETNNGLR